MTQEHEKDLEGEEGEEGQANPMEGLLAAAAQFQEKLHAHEVVWVKIVQVAADKVLVDIGEKHEAVIPLAEFEAGAPPAAGARVPALLVHGGRGDSPAVLSTKKASSAGTKRSKRTPRRRACAAR